MQKVNNKIKQSSKKDKATYSKIFSESYYESDYITPEYHDSTNPVVFLDI